MLMENNIDKLRELLQQKSSCYMMPSLYKKQILLSTYQIVEIEICS